MQIIVGAVIGTAITQRQNDDNAAVASVDVDHAVGERFRQLTGAFKIEIPIEITIHRVVIEDGHDGARRRTKFVITARAAVPAVPGTRSVRDAITRRRIDGWEVGVHAGTDCRVMESQILVPRDEFNFDRLVPFDVIVVDWVDRDRRRTLALGDRGFANQCVRIADQTACGGQTSTAVRRRAVIIAAAGRANHKVFVGGI